VAGEFSTNGALIDENLGTAYGVIAGARSGLMTGIAADADCYLLRNVGKRPFKVTMVRIRWLTTTAFASAQCLGFAFYKVYGCTAVHTGGTPTAIAPHWRFQGNVPATTLADTVPATESTVVVNVALTGVISGTAAITTATYTAPTASEPEVFAVAGGTTVPAIYEDWLPRDGLPLVLEQNTGFLGRNTLLMGASGAGRLFVGVDGYFL
jgi:hypothetical protein